MSACEERPTVEDGHAAGVPIGEVGRAAEARTTAQPRRAAEARRAARARLATQAVWASQVLRAAGARSGVRNGSPGDRAAPGRGAASPAAPDRRADS